jgi:chromosome segregation ATPase
MNEFKTWHLIIICAVIFIGGFLLRGAFRQGRAVREIQQSITDIRQTTDELADIKAGVDGAVETIRSIEESVGRARAELAELDSKLTEFSIREREIYKALEESTHGSIERVDKIRDGLKTGREILTELIEADTP